MHDRQHESALEIRARAHSSAHHSLNTQWVIRSPLAQHPVGDPRSQSQKTRPVRETSGRQRCGRAANDPGLQRPW